MKDDTKKWIINWITAFQKEYDEKAISDLNKLAGLAIEARNILETVLKEEKSL